MGITERKLFNEEAEQGLIGALLSDNRLLDDVACIVVSEDFFFAENRKIFETMLGMNGKPFDAVTLAEKDNEDLSSLDYLITIQRNVHSTRNATVHAGIIRDRKIERDLYECGQEIRNLCLDNSLNHQERLEASQIAFTSVSSEKQANTQVEIKSSLKQVLTSLEDRLEGKEDLNNIKTGYSDLDERLGGYRPGNLIIVGSRPGMGKTTFATGTAKHCATHYGKTLIFSLEMPHYELTQRLIACCGRVPMDVLRNPKKANDADWASISAGSCQIKEMPIIIDDQGGLSIIEVAARARREHRKGPVKMIIVDYLQLMNSGNKNYQGNRNLEIGAISMGLKNIAKELNCPVMALSQLSRGVEDRSDSRPKLSDLRDSGSIEQDADIVHFLYRDELYHEDTQNKGVLEIATAKFRDGVIGIDYLNFEGKFNLISDFKPGQQFQKEPEKQQRSYSR